MRAGLAASTVTPGSTAPELSLTTPAMLAWANAVAGTDEMSRIQQANRVSVVTSRMAALLVSRQVARQSGDLFLNAPTCHLEELLVLMADELGHLPAVCHDLLLDPHRERPGVRLRIVDRDVDLQVPEIHTPEPLGQPQRVGEWAAHLVEPGIARIPALDAAEVVRLHHERVALPMPDGVSEPVRLRLPPEQGG